MLTVNSKTFVCFFIVLILTLFSGIGGLVIGLSGRNIFPASWLSYFPKIGTETTLPLEFNKKPIKNIYLTVDGTVKSITIDKITIENSGESITLKLASGLQAVRFKAQPTGLIPTGVPSMPELLQIKDLKIGSQVSVSVRVEKDGLIVVSLVALN